MHGLSGFCTDRRDLMSLASIRFLEHSQSMSLRPPGPLGTVKELGLCSLDESVGLLGLVSPGWWKCLHVTVVASESVDSALNQDESELCVFVLSELLQMLSDLYSLFDQVVEVFGEVWGETFLFQDSEDFAASDALDLGDSVAISESDTDLRRHVSLLGKLNNLLNEVLGLDFDPAWSGLSVWQASAGDTLAL